jgi:Protein of unknown function (DUF3987)
MMNGATETHQRTDTDPLDFFFNLFLEHTTGNIELRSMVFVPATGKYDSDPRSIRKIFSRNIQNLREFIQRQEDGRDVFHGVYLRRLGASSGKKEDIAEAICIGADVDFKVVPQDRAKRSINLLALKPNLIIHSGNGYHPYWFLNEPFEIRGDDEISIVEGIGKGLAKQLGGDSVQDVARILRTPCRVNSKYERKPKPNIIHTSDTRYTIEELKRYWVPLENGKAKVDLGDIGELPERFQALLAKNRRVKDTWDGKRPDIKDQSGSGYDMAMADLLANYDYQPDEIAAVLVRMPSGKGNDATPAYLEHTIGKAFAGKKDSKANGKAEEKPDDWPDPSPLVMDIESEPYPLDALPKAVHAAVNEVQQFTKAPVALVASSALGAVSAAVQAHADVKRAEMLSGPVGLFLLTIADSGERKSSCDRLFTDAIRQYEAEQAEAAKPKVREHKAALDAWEAKRAGIKDKIRQLAKERKPTVEYERTLWEIEKDKPQSPRTPRLIYTDATPEALKWKLATAWPSAGVICAEAGIVFGSHGMGQDSIMRNLTTLNELWDGRPISTDRRSSESFTVRGARLTLALQVQETTLRSFFDRSNGLPRGTGFMARFLIAWPESTQGSRPFTEPPSYSPGLSAFNSLISNILKKAVPIDDDGALTPPVVILTPEAKKAWITFHDKIEKRLASGGELYDVRDVASKSADNAARLSALFQIFEKGMGGAVEVDAFENASRIVAWHLSESRRFFGELALPVELVNASHLDRWLIDHCRRNQTKTVSTRTVQQFGPARLREKSAIDSALLELEELGRVRTVKDGRRRTITVNPALIERDKA